MKPFELKVFHAFVEGIGLEPEQALPDITLDNLGVDSMDILQGVFEVEVICGVNLVVDNDDKLKDYEKRSIKKSYTLADAVRVLIARIESVNPQFRNLDQNLHSQ